MTIPSKQIEQEIRAQYPQHKTLTLALGDHLKGEENIRTVVAIVEFKNKIPAKEELRLQRWLAAELGCPTEVRDEYKNEKREKYIKLNYHYCHYGNFSHRLLWANIGKGKQD